MSQRKALIASLTITLVIALSAIGIRATLFDSPDAAADPESGLTLVVPGPGDYDDDDDSYEESDDESGSWIDAFTNNHDDHDDDEDHEHEEEHDDDEH